jgi:signal transduction histidine kinase/ActR/RegA family two-component response regulator
VLPTELPAVRLSHAGSVAAARAILRDSVVDVVLVDLSLPDARGLDALLRVREAAPWVPVIVLTGSSNERQALEALRAGAQDYMLKPPPDSGTLGRMLRYACERHRLLTQRDSALRAVDLAARRWRLLAEVGRALSDASNPVAALQEVARIIVPDAADCFALLLGGDDEVTTTIEILHVGGSSDELRARVQEVVGFVGATDDRQLEIANAPATGSLDDAVRLVFTSLGVASGTVVPVFFGGRAHGVLLLATLAGREDSLTDVDLGRSLADRIASSLEQAHLLRRMRRAVTARDRAVRIVSHDLRNPLSAIQICATALLDPEPAPPHGVRHMGELIQRSAAWMQQIVRDLLDRASIDSGQLVLHRESTGVGDVITTAQAMFEPVAREHAIEFVVQSGTELPAIDADRDRLLQALSNLIGNAIKFTPAGGRVTLSASRLEPDRAESRSTSRDDGVRFAVSDTGPGIPPEDLAHLFDWYWHAPRGSAGGTGMGLAIAKDLIEAHHARVHVESTLGQGSLFWFNVPAAPVQLALGDALT